VIPGGGVVPAASPLFFIIAFFAKETTAVIDGKAIYRLNKRS